MSENERFLNRHHGDAVVERDGKFWFYDETWANTIGPYDTVEEADEELAKYISEWLAEGPPDQPCQKKD